MPGWTARRLTDVPVVTDGGDDDPVWHPLQHFFGLNAFGVNAFFAREANQTLVEAHDERSSAQEELYLVLEGRRSSSSTVRGSSRVRARPSPFRLPP